MCRIMGLLRVAVVILRCPVSGHIGQGTRRPVTNVRGHIGLGHIVMSSIHHSWKTYRRKPLSTASLSITFFISSPPPPPTNIFFFRKLAGSKPSFKPELDFRSETGARKRKRKLSQLYVAHHYNSRFTRNFMRSWRCKMHMIKTWR